MIFIFLGSVWKYPCLGKLFQKIKIVCWSWSLEARLTLTSKNRWWFSFFYFLDWKYPFWVNLDQKVKTVSLSWNWIPRLFWRWKIRWWCSLVLFSPFFSSFVEKIHLVFWCYFNNLPAGYSQRRDASGLFCFN